MGRSGWGSISPACLRGRPTLLGTRLAKDAEMAALGSPARTLRGLLRELRYLNAATGRPYRDTAAYRYLVKAFRAHRVRNPRLVGSGSREGRMKGGLGRVRCLRRPGLYLSFSPRNPTLRLTCGLKSPTGLEAAWGAPS